MELINIPKNKKPLTEQGLLEYGFADITDLVVIKVRNFKQFSKSYGVKGSNEQATIFIYLGSRGWTFHHKGSPLYKYEYQLEVLYFMLSGNELTKQIDR